MSIETTEVIHKTEFLRSINQEFAQDVKKGLTAREKNLPSKYLYNKKGDKIFQDIMAMPEYYLTRAEHEIFSTQKAAVLQHFAEGDSPFQLIEFGAGDGMKTKVLLEHFVSQQIAFSYVPIDISENILQKLIADLGASLPSLQVQGIGDDYFRAIERLSNTQQEPVRKIILFLGANIGNFNQQESHEFLRKIADRLLPGDRLMIGFDLKKDPAMILDAYFDKTNITRDFNLNLLQRINDELGGNFKLDTFQYAPIYDPMEGSVKSYLVSRQEQDIYIEALHTSIHFEAWEAIYMERSQKFSLSDIDKLAQATGFRVVNNFYDSRHYFTDSLWELASP